MEWGKKKRRPKLTPPVPAAPVSAPKMGLQWSPELGRLIYDQKDVGFGDQEKTSYVTWGDTTKH